MKKLTTEEFIKRAKETHGTKYDYSLVDYKNTGTKVKIVCPEHGVFEQRPGDHLNKHGCPVCSGTASLTTEEFIKRAKEIHGGKYDYSLVDYKNCRTKVKIICPVHGVFEQIAETHINGCGCLKCKVDNMFSNKEKFIKKTKEIYGSKYDYSLVDYIDSKTKIRVVCSKHGVFETTPNRILNGHNCPECSKEEAFEKNKNSFFQKSKEIHYNKYNYSKVNYVNNYTKVEIICPIHGSFWQEPGEHKRGRGCPKCNESSGEKRIEIFLKENNINYEAQKRFKELGALSFDFYISSKNTLIEFNGEQHYKPIEYFGGEKAFKKQINNDNKKKEFAKHNGIKLLIISFKEFSKIEEILKEELNGT